MTENLILNGSKRYFFDTYALIEILNDNPNYAKHQDLTLVTGLLNYGELFYHIMKEHKEKQAVSFMAQLRRLLLSVNINDIIKAMNFKYHNRKRKFSFVDCVGYAMAKRRNLVFLTGDEEFKDMGNIEFVK